MKKVWRRWHKKIYPYQHTLIYKTFFKVLEQQHQYNINIFKTFQQQYQEHTIILMCLKYTTKNKPIFFFKFNTPPRQIVKFYRKTNNNLVIWHISKKCWQKKVYILAKFCGIYANFCLFRLYNWKLFACSTYIVCFYKKYH